MQFIDLEFQQKRIRAQLQESILSVLDHGKYIMGPEVREVEAKLASYSGVKHGISCASGTDALLLALMAYGIGPGSAVLTSPFTFIATAEVIQLLGATPVFVDIEATTFNMDSEHLKKAVHALKNQGASSYPLPKSTMGRLVPRAIIAVDLFGLPADYDGINEIAAEEEMVVIEDAAQSFGAEYKGRKTCSLSAVGCTSFFPAKPLGCYGDGGMCFTDDDELAGVIKSLRVHGQGSDKYDNVRVGINGRMDTMQAAILLSKFSIFPEEIELRQEVARRYGEHLAGIEGLTVPQVPPHCTSVWAQYSVLSDSEVLRERIRAALKAAGVPTAVYYPKPLHLQTAFSHLGYRRGDFPVSEAASQRIFSLPMHPYLQAGDQMKIADLIRNLEK